MLTPTMVVNEKIFGQRLPENLVHCKTCNSELVFCKSCKGTTEYQGFGRYEYKCKHCGEPLPCIKNIVSGAIDLGFDKVLKKWF